MEYVVDWESVCLVCLQEGNMRPIYEKDGKNVTFYDKITMCSNINIQKGKNFPQQICAQCIQDLEAAYRFRLNCESSNIILKSFIERQDTNLEISASNKNIYKYKPASGLKVKKIITNDKNSLNFKEEIQTEDGLNFKEEIQTEDSLSFKEEIQPEDSNDAHSNEFLFSNENYDITDNNKKTHSTTEIVILEDIKIENNNSKSSCITEVSKVKEQTSDLTIKKKKVPRKSKEGKISPSKFQSAELNVTKDNVSSMVNNLSTLTYVKKTRDDSKPQKICEICGNSYKYQHALDSHMRRHRNEKPYACEFCDRAFVANVELRRHMRVHTGQKPYGCRFCTRCFSDFGSRIKHERTHTGERPYTCDTCGKSFAYAHVLSVHILTHTGEKKFKCEFCGKGFTKKIYLNAHMAHHEEINYIHIESQQTL